MGRAGSRPLQLSQTVRRAGAWNERATFGDPYRFSTLAYYLLPLAYVPAT
jgi:hypothetical protein